MMPVLHPGWLALSILPAALVPSAADAQSLDLGRKAYQECIACHATEKGSNGVGPSLAGIVGTRAGDVEGFRFSGPMKRSAIVWTPEVLNKFIADPQAVIPGTRMPYSGMADAIQREALLQYLGTLK